MSLRERLLRRSAPGLLRLACILALLSLTLFCYSVADPSPLPVILAMSVGHVIGAAAVVCYLLAILLDAIASAARPDDPEPHET